uniref:Integrase family protein n=1 Tax=Cyanothece sp. (strain PCC 7425 / ATCC 29141) TaxID=395961 RepID=B8HJK7_CYAP4
MKFSVNLDKSSYRIDFTLEGKRKRFYPGTTDELTALNIARRMSYEWEQGIFDTSLASYKVTAIKQPNPGKHGDKPSQIAPDSPRCLLELWDRWVDYLKVPEDSLHHYRNTRAMIRKSGNPAIDDCTWFLDLKAQYAPSTWNLRKSYLKSCLEWAIREEFYSGKNIYALLKPARGGREDRVKPFTKEEIQVIIEAMESNRFCKSDVFKHSHYVPLVKFLFSTGVRTGEAIGLRWKHIDWARREVLIAESLSRVNGVRKRKPTKTGETGWVPMTPSLYEALLAIKPESPNPEALVFQPPAGGSYINPDNFRRRIWRLVLEGLGIEYRYPYQARHTVLSHIASKQGLLAAAKVGRHKSLDMVSKHYARFVDRVDMPDLV